MAAESAQLHSNGSRIETVQDKEDASKIFHPFHSKGSGSKRLPSTTTFESSNGASSNSYSPTLSYSWTGVKLGSPPPLGKNVPSVNLCSDTTVESSKPITLDLSSFVGPSITITPMSELESDAEISSPSIKDTRSMSCFMGNGSPLPQRGASAGAAGSQTGMHYLSPFSIVMPMPSTTSPCSSSSRTTSESNLSSSGYSSMASPGPSRSGSFNPISANSESEDASSGGTPTRMSCGAGGSSFFHHPISISHSSSSSSSCYHPPQLKLPQQPQHCSGNSTTISGGDTGKCYIQAASLLKTAH